MNRFKKIFCELHLWEQKEAKKYEYTLFKNYFIGL